VLAGRRAWPRAGREARLHAPAAAHS